MRFARIVATIGPASRDPAVLGAMIRAGLDVARLNASHGDLADHEATCRVIREVADREDKPVGVLLDLAGPKLRTGPTPGGLPVALPTGSMVRLVPGTGPCAPDRVSVSYPGLLRDVLPGQRVLLADGDLELLVESVDAESLHCAVVAGGALGERRGAAFPDSELALPALTPDDERALAAGVRAGVDYFGLSFVAGPEHVREARQRVAALGADTPLIAKIERRAAVDRLDAILAEADGAMVARGDLGVEIPLERVPIEQRRIIQAAGRRLRPVITATQMLDSMVSSPRPTRAEASDVANAIWDRSDAVMLSEETAVGRYPVEAVAMMDRLIRSAESVAMQEHLPLPDLETDNHSFVIAAAARRMAEYDHNIRAIVCFTTTGVTATLLSKVHPPVPVYAISPRAETCRRLSLARGVVPIRGPWTDSPDEMLRVVDDVLISRGLLERGSEAVVVASLPLRARGVTNFLKLHRVGETGTFE